MPVGKNQNNGFNFGIPSNSKIIPLQKGNNLRQQNFNFKNNLDNQQESNVLQKNSMSDWNYTLAQYQIFHNSNFDEVEKGLSSFDFRIKYAAILVVGEKNIPVGNKLFDLLDDRNEYVQQAARKALAVKSYYLIKEIKEISFSKKNINLKVNPSNLKIGIDYVDFGPMAYDSEELIAVSVTRWKEWFSKKENHFNSLQEKKSKFNSN